MRYWRYRFRLPRLRLPLLRRGYSHYNHHGLRRLLTKRTLAGLLALVVCVIGFVVVLERRASPQIHALTETLARQQAAEAISAAVEQVLTEEQVSYDRLVSYSVSDDGIRSIQTNALEVNLLRARVNVAVEEAVTLRRGRLRIPMGAIMGSELFAGRGPNISVPLRLAGSALSDIRSDLSTAGLNQTMHRILMDLTVTISVILPGGAETFEVEMTVALAETVIVGNVPGGLIATQ